MRLIEIFLVALRLGLTSFGGPLAHLAYFHEVYVKKKKWLTDAEYADLVGLCQFLPGPSSSQVGMAIGLARSGIPGALISWIGFTFPSALMLALFGLGVIRIELDKYLSVLHGLKLVAVAVVAQAVWGMAKRLCPDRERIVIAVVSCAFVFILAGPLVQIGVLLVAGLVGSCWLRIPTKLPAESATQKGTKRGVFFLFMFFGLLVALPGLRSLGHSARLFDSFYRSGALVFGGGHVVLPMLRTEVVPPGWVSSDLFMVGYGLAHAIPGPLFTFSAYLGAVSSQKPNGWVGASIALIAMFLPAFLLIVGVLPFWSKLRSFSKVRQAMAGVNAAVVGILLASFFSPVWTSAIFSFQDLGLAVVGFLMLETRGLPSWAMVLFMVGLSFAAQ